MKNGYSNYLEEQDYKKAVGQMRLQFGEILSVFDMHGLGILIPGAVEELVQVAEAYGQRIRGKDKPIMVKKRLNPRRE